ncbi:MAG: PDZ domain-containing protein [Gammaproteobacteria bacterium]|nr:PDZ domain-containing protein [Gammaproteobacteria bacterium]MDD9897068.1 PDZ domain-containing protein [Gammaproteobacteria bacterium]MDD9959791.1 PDZ domain-containing protein [Gammaproteobacteria bacterium]
MLLASLQLAGCISYEPGILTPAITLSSEDISLTDAANENLKIDFGLEAGLNESDSLLNIEILPGVRVRNVVTNGPAATAGIQVGDVILAIDDLDTNHPDAIEALQQTADSTSFEFRVQRDTTVFGTTVIGRTINNSNGPIELYRIDPIATRAGYSTVMLTINNQSAAAAKVEALFPSSPLPAAGIGDGDIILRLNGRNLNSAQDLVTRLNREHELGEEVQMTIYNDGNVTESSVQLWDPGRRINRINVGPLLRYESSLNPSSENFSILDFWVFAVYSYTRTEGERSHSIFGLFNISSDYGELTELEN